MNKPKSKPNTTTDGEIPVIRWSNRRKMAWRAFWVLVICTVGYWFILPLWFQYWLLPTTWLDIIAESYFWFAMTMASVIVGYLGFTTLPFIGRGRSSRDDVRIDESDDNTDSDRQYTDEELFDPEYKKSQTYKADN